MPVEPAGIDIKTLSLPENFPAYFKLRLRYFAAFFLAAAFLAASLLAAVFFGCLLVPLLLYRRRLRLLTSVADRSADFFSATVTMMCASLRW
jgi:hypothetical protein